MFILLLERTKRNQRDQLNISKKHISVPKFTIFIIDVIF